MSEERRRRQLIEEKLAAKRECPVPKPGGLIGQVLGVHNEDEENKEEQKLSIMQRVEKAMCQPWSKKGKTDDQ
jgi:cytochrome c oxidase assembly factor 2